MQAIKTDNAPRAIGAYSQAIVHGNLVYVSGQIPINPATGNIEGSTIEAQTAQVLKNIEAILVAAGSTLTKVIKCTVFLTDLRDFTSFNKVYGETFAENPPARSTVQVLGLPRDAKIEMELIAHT